MKAAVQSVYGPPDVLTLAEVDRPAVGDHEVLVEVHASAVTQADRRLRSGDFPGITWLPGRLVLGLRGPRSPIPGSTFAGRVAEVGRRVTRFSPGDDVFGSSLRGAYSEYLAVGEDAAIARMPAGIAYEEAAALPYGAGTALVFLRDLAAVQPGERVCILGASGGVGRFAVQLARHLGAEVTGVCSEANLALAQSLGAHRVLDYRAGDFRDAGEQYDVILDTVGATRFDLCRGSLTPTGRYLSLLVSARLLVQMFVSAFVGHQRAFAGTAMDRQQDIEDVRSLVEQGALRPVIASTFPLERIADAHAHLEAGRPAGDVVVSCRLPAGVGSRGLPGGRHPDVTDLLRPGEGLG